MEERDNQISLVTQEAFLEEVMWKDEQEMTGEKGGSVASQRKRCSSRWGGRGGRQS